MMCISCTIEIMHENRNTAQGGTWSTQLQIDSYQEKSSFQLRANDANTLWGIWNKWVGTEPSEWEYTCHSLCENGKLPATWLKWNLRSRWACQFSECILGEVQIKMLLYLTMPIEGMNPTTKTTFPLQESIGEKDFSVLSCNLNVLLCRSAYQNALPARSYGLFPNKDNVPRCTSFDFVNSRNMTF